LATRVAPKGGKAARRKAPAKGAPKKSGIAEAMTPRSLAAAVQAALSRAAGAGPPDASASKLDHVADALVTKACAGDVQAIKAVFKRIDGKVTAEQASDTPREIVIVHTFKSRI
jgi:hypothetical protein